MALKSLLSYLNIAEKLDNKGMGSKTAYFGRERAYTALPNIVDSYLLFDVTQKRFNI